MTSATGTENAFHGSGTGKSLKDQNWWQLWIIVAANSLFLYGVMQANVIQMNGLRNAFMHAQNLVPLGVALVITTVLNGLVSADMKSRLVFLRWNHALPGHRAFSKYVLSDPRIDVLALEKLNGGFLPVEPVEQNRAWYQHYNRMGNDIAVRQVHRDFLLLRDYTGLSAVFIIIYGAAGLYAIKSVKVGLGYLALLLLQYAIARQAASNYGVRMVKTVLARRAAKEETEPQETPRRRESRRPKSRK